LFPYELVLRLCKVFHLAQDFYWFNPSRLPTPAEWVTIRRTRVTHRAAGRWRGATIAARASAIRP